MLQARLLCCFLLVSRGGHARATRGQGKAMARARELDGSGLGQFYNADSAGICGRRPSSSPAVFSSSSAVSPRVCVTRPCAWQAQQRQCLLVTMATGMRLTWQQA